MHIDIDAEFLREACQFAIVFSSDLHTQNGAILVANSGDKIVTANMLPAIYKSPERLERPLKYTYIEHAERNAVYAAARAGICTLGATLYCPWFACADCARAIIQAGITQVVGHETLRAQAHDYWRDTIASADQMLHEAGVETRLISTPLNISILFNGQLLEL